MLECIKMSSCFPLNLNETTVANLANWLVLIMCEFGPKSELGHETEKLRQNSFRWCQSNDKLINQRVWIKEPNPSYSI